VSRGLLLGIFGLTFLAVGVYWSEKARQADAGKPDPNAAPKLISVAAPEIQQVTIARKDAEPAILERVNANQWQITQPSKMRADVDVAAQLVTTLADLHWERLVEEKAANLNEFGLATPAVKVSFQKKGGKAQSILIGDETPTGGNFYAKLEGDPRVFLINNSTKGSIDRSAAELRDKRLVPFDESKLSKVQISSRGLKLDLAKNANGDWAIVSPDSGRADGFEIEELLRKLREARIDEATVSLGSLRPLAAVAITDAAGTYTLGVSQGPNNALYGRSSEVEGLHKLPEDFAKSLSSLELYRNKKLFDFGFNELKKIELRASTVNLDFVRADGKWWVNGKEMDPAGTQIFIDKLRDLTASKLYPLGPSSTNASVKVTWGDGNRTETVEASVDAARVFARRAGESAGYELVPSDWQAMLQAASDVKPATPSKKPSGTK
jgi:hypothetical protein